MKNVKIFGHAQGPRTRTWDVHSSIGKRQSVSYRLQSCIEKQVGINNEKMWDCQTQISLLELYACERNLFKDALRQSYTKISKFI